MFGLVSGKFRHHLAYSFVLASYHHFVSFRWDFLIHLATREYHNAISWLHTQVFACASCSIFILCPPVNVHHLLIFAWCHDSFSIISTMFLGFRLFIFFLLIFLLRWIFSHQSSNVLCTYFVSFHSLNKKLTSPETFVFTSDSILTHWITEREQKTP